MDKMTSRATPFPSPALYSEPDAHPPASTMPTPKISPATTECIPDGDGWKVLNPLAVTMDATNPKKNVAVMMPTTILGTPTANRSRKAEEKQNLPYCRH